jgi:predicted amidohydrolase
MRVAVAQIEPKLAEKERNLDACLRAARGGGRSGAELLVLPGVRDPGLHVRQRRRRRSRTPRRSPALRPRRSSASAAGSCIHAICGSSSATGTRSYNAAILVGPDGPDPAYYRKTHLPSRRLDRFVTRATSEVFDTALGRIA